MARTSYGLHVPTPESPIWTVASKSPVESEGGGGEKQGRLDAGAARWSQAGGTERGRSAGREMDGMDSQSERISWSSPTFVRTSLSFSSSDSLRQRITRHTRSAQLHSGERLRCRSPQRCSRQTSRESARPPPNAGKMSLMLAGPVAPRKLPSIHNPLARTPTDGVYPSPLRSTLAGQSVPVAPGTPPVVQPKGPLFQHRR